MDRIAESGGKREPLSADRKLALQAKGIFIDVSRDNPASGIGQAARIAYRCRSLGLSPELLGDSLASQEDLVEEIRTKGNEHHKQSDAKRTTPLTTEEVRRVIGADFLMADDLINLSNEHLQEIYSASEGKPTTNQMEEQLIDKASRLLGLYGIDFEYITPDARDDAR